MITFIVAIVLLIARYFIYGHMIEKFFGADDSIKTPAVRLEDGIDFVPMPIWRIFMIQFLNIAGLGPIFGAVMGALYGPSAFIWIVFGCIFAGAVHDYFSGMLSVRHDGISIPEVVGHYLGNGFRQFMRAFSVILLLLVGVVFILGPANIMTDLTKDVISLGPVSVKDFWIYVIFAYYLAATVLPIDKIIGKVYPAFGVVLFVMAAGLLWAIFRLNAPIPELTFATMHNMHSHPETHPLFPMLFITIACGAISGFHATQSPMMARCITTEKQGRKIFYGAMIAEGLVALIWAAAAMSYFENTAGLNQAMAEHGDNAAWVVKTICNSWLGKVGGILAILGVVACPVTSGGTAFRSARMIIADFVKFNQKPMRRRLLISVPLFVAAWFVSRMDFSVVWRYFGFSNQTLAAIVLWASAMYMVRINRTHWIATIPAVFMTAVCTTYILIAPEGFKLSTVIAYPAGIAVAVAALGLFLYKSRKAEKKTVESTHGKPVLQPAQRNR